MREEVILSVIIPCYNAQRYLDECVQSVTTQMAPAMEILLVDDGSTDATGRLCDGWAEKDARIRVFHLSNGGVSAARNAALRHAKGVWVTFVDADDIVPPGAFERLLSSATQEIDLVMGAHETLQEDGTRTKVLPEVLFPAGNKARAKEIVIARLIEGDVSYNIMCAKLHRRAFLDAQGIALCETVNIGEDALLNLEAVARARQFVYIKDVCYTYRMHGQSASQKGKDMEFARHRPFFIALQALLLRLDLYPRYFRAYANSVVLRLYKESGFFGVLRRFNKDARPLLALQRASGIVCLLMRKGLYPAAYVFIFPCQVLRRKVLAGMRRLRHE